MPVFDFACQLNGDHRFEAYLSRRENPDPDCNQCGGTTRRLISRFAAIWTKNISEYGDPKKETWHQDLKNEGHIVYRKRSQGGTVDKPIAERITSVAQQNRYCREEGLYQPGEVGSFSVDKSGEGCSSQGMPGSWI